MSAPSSPGRAEDGGQEIYEQLASNGTPQRNLPFLANDPRTPTLDQGPQHAYSKSQPFVSSADIYAAQQALGGTGQSQQPHSSKSLAAHSASSSLEFLAGQDELRAMQQGPCGFGSGTPTSVSVNTKRASVLSFQTALSGSIANYLSADDSASGSARSSHANITSTGTQEPSPSTDDDLDQSNAQTQPDSAEALRSKLASPTEQEHSFPSQGEANAQEEADVQGRDDAEAEVDALAELERAQQLRSKMVSPTMAYSTGTMTSRDRDSLRDSFRESLMMNGGTGSSPSSTTSPRGSRGKGGLRPLHLVNAAAAGTSAVDAFNGSTNGSPAPGTLAGSAPNSPRASVIPAEALANRRSSGLWSGPGSPPMNGMRTAGNRSSAAASPALHYIDSSGATPVTGTPVDLSTYRARQRRSLQLQSPVPQSSASMYTASPATTGTVTGAAPSSAAVALALLAQSPSPASPMAIQQLQADAALDGSGSGAATPSPSGLSGAFGTPALGAASTHATAQQHTTMSPEKARALAAEHLASMPVTHEVLAGESASVADQNGVVEIAAEEVMEAPTVVPSQATSVSRSRAGTTEGKDGTTANGDGTFPILAPDQAPAQVSIAPLPAQDDAQAQQLQQSEEVTGEASAPADSVEQGINGGPHEAQAQHDPAAVATPVIEPPIPAELAHSTARLQAAMDHVQFLQEQAVTGVGTRPPAEIAAMAVQAQVLANQQAVLQANYAGVPRDAKTFPGVQPQHSLVPPFELQQRPDGLPSAMIGPDGIRRSLNDPEVCLECMMRDEDMIDVHVNAAAFWERESDSQFKEGCYLERDDEERRKTAAAALSVRAESEAGNSMANGVVADDTASSLTGQTAATKVETGFGVTHIVGQTGISISPRDAMGMVRIGGSRMRVKRIAKGDPLTAERLKLHTQMNPPASSHRWRALQNFLATQAKYIAMEQRARYEAAAAAEREAVRPGQVANVQYDNKIIRGATVADAKARQANGIYVEDVNLGPAEQEQKARDIAKAQDLRKRTSQRASIVYDANRQLPAVPPEIADLPVIQDGAVPAGLAEPPQIIGGNETPNMAGAVGGNFNTPSAASRLGPAGNFPSSPMYSNGDERLAHAALSPGSPLGPSTPGIGAGQPLGSPMSLNRSGYGLPDVSDASRMQRGESRTSPSSRTKSDMGREDHRPSSLGPEDSLNKGRSKGVKKLLSKVTAVGLDGESVRSGSLEKQQSAEVDEGPDRNRASVLSAKGQQDTADAPVASRFASIINDGRKRSASALGFSGPTERSTSSGPDTFDPPPVPAVSMPPGGYYNDPALAASQTSLDIGPFQNPVPPPRHESKTIAQQQRKKPLPVPTDGLPVDDDVVAELASRPGRPARNSAAALPATRSSSETGSPNVNIGSSPKANANGSATFGSRLSAQSIGSATLEAARKSVSSFKNSTSGGTTSQSQQFASTTPSMASLREVADDSTSMSRAQFGATPTPSRTRNRSGSTQRGRDSADWLKPTETRATPRKRSFFFRRSKMPSVDQVEDLAPRNMPARPMTSMGLHGEGSGLGRMREEKAASRFQRLLGGLFGTSSKKKRSSLASGRSGQDFDPFNRASAGSRASGFLKSGGLSLPRLLRSRASNSNMDKPISLEKGISNHDPLPSLRAFEGARDERGLPLRAQSAMGRLPSQKFATSGPSFGRPTWASPRSFDEDDEEPADAEMRRDPIASKRKGLGGSRTKLSTGSDALLKSPAQFGGSSSSIATSFTQYGGGPPPRLPMRQSSRGSNMKANINLSLPGVHEV